MRQKLSRISNKPGSMFTFYQQLPGQSVQLDRERDFTPIGVLFC